VVPEVASTEEPQRTRQRIPEGGTRQRVRVQADGQRFRARPVGNREENTEENAQQHTPQRPRGRQVVRVRATTESPAAEGENVPDRDVSRTKTRFRAIDRTRIGARQQQVVRSRQPIAQDEVELPKPVRHGPSTERVINDAPVFASENESEVEIATVRATTEAATTQKPGRRFNNFGVGQRTRRIRPVANQEPTESTTTSAPPSRNFATARPIRRQSTAAPIARSTLRGGARLRKPTTTESPEIEEAVANVQTGAFYSKNQFVKVVKEEAPEEEQAPVRAVPKKVAAKVQPVENYPPNYNFDEDAPETVVYRPRIRVPSRTRYTPPQDDSEFNVEESQRSEQFSIQQLDDAVSLLKTYYNTKYDEEVPSDVERISFTEPQPESTDLPIVEEQSTELKLEADTTEAVPTTEQVPEVNTAPTEEPKVEKYSSKIKVRPSN